MRAHVADRALHRLIDLPVSLALAADPELPQRLCELLDATGLFDGLSWPGARDVADAITADAGRPDGAKVMRHRAQTVALGCEVWDDQTVVWALSLAAGVLDDLGVAR